MYNHVNPKNGEKSPLIDDKVFEVIMQVSEGVCGGGCQGMCEGVRWGADCSTACRPLKLPLLRCVPGCLSMLPALPALPFANAERREAR